MPKAPVPDTILRLVENFDRKIDGLVCELYGLTEKEIKIVEAATK